MKTLKEYIIEKDNTNWKNVGWSALKFLIFIGGLTAATYPGFASIGAITMIFSFLWASFSDNSWDESLDNSEEKHINEGMQDMAKGLLNKLLEIDCVKKLIDNISKLDGYEELKKNKDIKGLAKLINAYYKNHKDEIKEVNDALKKTQV